MNKIVKHYYDLSYEYYRVAATLWANLNDAPRAYNPMISLLKQTVSFLLKGLILKEQTRNFDIDYIGAAKIEADGKQVRLNTYNSVTGLWKHYKIVNKEQRICTYYTEQEEKFLDRMVKKCDVPDCDSTAISMSAVRTEEKDNQSKTRKLGEKKLELAKNLFNAVDILRGYYGGN